MIVNQSQKLSKQTAGDEKKQTLVFQTADKKLYKTIVAWPTNSDAAE